MSYNIFDNNDEKYYVSVYGNVINNGSENVETKRVSLVDPKTGKVIEFDEKINNYYITFLDINYNSDVKANGITLEFDTGNNTSENKILLNYNGVISTKKGNKEFKLKKIEDKIIIENTNYYLKKCISRSYRPRYK